ncbi:hypothetical protein TNCV_3312581 [Trichonephila clavipes]|nr:hypothetical protein TNCV_3312581 [Trichonephila clavipes]
MEFISLNLSQAQLSSQPTLQISTPPQSYYQVTIQQNVTNCSSVDWKPFRDFSDLVRTAVRACIIRQSQTITCYTDFISEDVDAAAEGTVRASVNVPAIRDNSRSCLDPNDFTVLNCIVKDHASLSPPSLRLRLCSRFTLFATKTYFDPKDFSPHPIDSVKGHASLSPFAQQKAKKKIKQKRNRFTK